MNKTAKIKKFKIAFLKPKTDNKAAIKHKTNVEKHAKAVTKKDTASEKTDVRKLIAHEGEKLKPIDNDYLIDLLAYKITKHWDEQDELDSWVMYFGDPSDRVAAMKKVLGANPSTAAVLECWQKCGESPHITAMCYELKPDAMVNEALRLIDEGQKIKINCKPMQSQVTKILFDQKGSKDTPKDLADTILPKDAVELAKKNPSDFVKFFFHEKVAPSRKAELLSQPETREALKSSKADWDELVKTTPMLPFLENVLEVTEDVDPEEKTSETIKVVFKQLLSDKSPMQMTYYTNQLSPPFDIMGASREGTLAKLDKHRQDLEKSRREDDPLDDTDEKLASLPKVPGCQCDELVTLLMRMTEAALGPNSGVECKHEVLPGMVLTVPMSTLPGGLLKKSFGGNVYDDSNKLTGQVLFTGNPDGDDPDAHTILKVGGTYYDAVLGTSGEAVHAAVAEQFSQWDKKTYKLKPEFASKDAPNKPVWVAKSKSSGNWIIKQPGLKAAPNNNGFNSAYRMTTKLMDYVEKI